MWKVREQGWILEKNTKNSQQNTTSCSASSKKASFVQCVSDASVPMGMESAASLTQTFFFLIFMYVFISLFLAVLGLHCFTRAFPSYSKQGLPFITTTVLQRMGFSLPGFLSQWSSGSRLQ